MKEELKRGKGRPCAYPNTQEGLRCLIIESKAYIRKVQQDGIKFRWERWAEWLHITKPTLWAYSKRGTEWSQAIEGLRQEMKVNK